MVAHAYDGLPLEACGLLAGRLVPGNEREQSGEPVADIEVARRLWAVSEDLTGVTYSI